MQCFLGGVGIWGLLYLFLETENKLRINKNEEKTHLSVPLSPSCNWNLKQLLFNLWKIQPINSENLAGGTGERMCFPNSSYYIILHSTNVATLPETIVQLLHCKAISINSGLPSQESRKPPRSSVCVHIYMEIQSS